MNFQTETFMQAGALVALLLYLVSSFRIFPARTTRLMQGAAIAIIGAAIVLALVETVLWFSGGK
ncbi:MAG: hypothetical protein ACK5JM_11835 [Rhodoblastus sp.]